MTPEQKAELRRLVGDYKGFRLQPIQVADAACDAILQLLDELEAGRAELENWAPAIAENGELRTERDSQANLLDEYRKQFVEDHARINAQGAQIVVLHHELQEWVRFHKEYVPEADHDGDCCNSSLVALADTEAAATTWLEADRREQRLAGARALLDRLETADFDDRAFYQATQRLEAMQREARR